MDIRNQVQTFSVEESDSLADQLFMAASGINREGPKYQRMRDEAWEIRRRIRDRVTLKAVWSYFDKVHIKDQEAQIGDVGFRCNGFSQIQPEQVQGAYVHIVTAGEYYLDREPIMNQLFADMWGSAFAEAARLRLLETLEGDQNLSEEFGPGYYGMDALQMTDLGQLVDPGLIGVEIRNTGILVPIKSCGGISFKVGQGYVRLGSECADCRGNRTHCSQCGIRIMKEQDIE